MHRKPGRRPFSNWRGSALLVCLAATSAFADAPYSAPMGNNYPLNLYWGDTHVHTRNSSDAYTLGNGNFSPADAYRFARGEEVTAHNGMRARLRRPLDFLVVADHGEYLGGFYRYNAGDPLVVNTEVALKQWSRIAIGVDFDATAVAILGTRTDPENYPPFPPETSKLIWQDVAETADDYNDPGRFTTLIGYEWTSMIDGNNLHRVVIYRDATDRVARLPPFSAQDSLDPRDLWQALARYEAETGGQVIAVPHNPNLSNGMMFPARSVDGRPIDRAYAKLRARWEPIVEVTQVKGDSEAHPLLSPQDEFAGFETWDRDNIGRTAAKEDWMLSNEYARSALKRGLGFEADLGANPFKFGMIGSTDTHTSLATAAEDNFFGKFPESEPGPQRLQTAMADGRMWASRKLSASGYAAVWARENTREELFAAMKRREVYATTGPRIAVRFFGGWHYEPGDVHKPAYLDIAYGKGVPMGGDIIAAPEGGAPTFIVHAAKDPDGANLDRIQIVKGWLDGSGNLHEKVFDVALSDGRGADPENGQVPPVGSTVNVTKATYDNTIGDPTLAAVWTDPDFDPGARAFYYVRVLQIPTPRWTTYDASYFRIALPDDIPATVQDRAYTSPIWYTP